MNERPIFRPCTCLAALLVAAASIAAERPKLLYITTTADFHHDACEYSIPIIQKLAEASGAFDVVVSDKTDLISRASLASFAGVCFSNTTGDRDKFPLSEENRNALIDAIKGGTAFVAIHAASDTYKDWEPFSEMLGGSFNGHPWNEEIEIEIEDPSHPSASMLPSRWALADEIYTFKNYSRDKCHVIMSMAKESEKGKGNRADGDYALAWAKMCGAGRVFYTALGHRHEVWDNPLFQQHLLGGIQWALGQKGSPLSPGHRKVESKWERIFDGVHLNFGTEWEATDDQGQTRKHWTVQPGGILQGFGAAGTPDSSHLYYVKKEFRNFEARADLCIDKDGNSGWYFRCPRATNQNRPGPGQWQNWPTGYEFQINNHSGDPKRTGTFYPNPTLLDADIAKYLGYDPAKDDGNFWFQMHIIAVGNHFVCKLNGKVAVDYVHEIGPGKRHEKGRWEEGLFAFQMHHPGTIVKIKNLEVRELSPDFRWPVAEEKGARR